MRRYLLRRSMNKLPPARDRAATGGPTAQRRPQRRSCLRQRSDGQRLLAAAALHGPLPDPTADAADPSEIEQANDLFLGLPWWTSGPAKSVAERETSAPSFEPRSGEGEDSQDLATILQRALMDLASALQEIERQLTSVPDDTAASTRG